ncbi:hypothetical protein S7711_00862 [Stachybotrys chartarum IBT 7711]|uniref:RRM domain-containing protein n=1 Tax=Stachybotrys chartarum (strain CBS 109288 / IBT 7711) TaxID=1280523 RepID=A0A084B0F9_STACB|nr:hypothetical protein S7711_00862 [Stachybotrys chartarum IBT 7711]KFA50157.1 hypothetical protein S40293_03663 [Stachybotrys chartarum IBT 40293]KFA78139.1 hypothetical protein S40288_01416 [Stachybotrys chartarum IBT 40288]
MDPSFPVDVQEFDSDERISFSRLDNKFIAVHDDGTEYEFDADAKRWIPTDESPSDQEIQQLAGEDAPPPRADEENSRKRRNGPEKSQNPSKKQKPPPQPKQNTAVYVTGLPLDATVSEVHDLFSRKAGVIAEEIDSGAPRIKLYSDSEGRFKGDALVVFFKPQSVNMAIMLLDDTYFRVTDNGTRDGRIRVQEADSSYKKVQYNKEGDGPHAADPAKSQQADRKPQKNDKDRHKIIKKTQKLDAKLADWDDDDSYLTKPTAASKWDKVVILRHMFTLAELKEDPAALLEIKEDIREECSKLGSVTNVVLYDLEPEGVVSVKFNDVESAAACINMMHGRNFDGRTVEATLATGNQKFLKSKNEDNKDDEE